MVARRNGHPISSAMIAPGAHAKLRSSREDRSMAHGNPPFNVEAALCHPSYCFAERNDVVAHPQLSRDVKLAVLREWEQDARRLSTSESEGMGGGEESMLGRVEAAIQILVHEQSR